MKSKKLIFASLLIATSSMAFAESNSFGNNQSYQNQSWQDVYHQTLGEVKSQREQQQQNFIYNLNQRIDQIEQSKRTSFEINAPQQVDVYVRESYTVLEKDFVVKNAPVWKKVLIKQKEVWDY